jgi:D-serine deaminase-like pyridoxal phosphate-dependent protein
MQRNIARMKARLARFGVAFRPHVKTCKSIDVARHLMTSPRGPITVSTLKEADQFFAQGVSDILYAVGIVPAKLDHVTALRARGCDLTVLLDSVEVAQALARYCSANGVSIPTLIEVDTDGHRSGVRPDDARLLDIADALGGALLRGVMTHAGASYECRSDAALVAMAEQERAGAVQAAERLRGAGYPAPVVSVGSTPTASFAQRLDGVTEVRAGVFVFFDLVMAGIGVCSQDDIALSVLTTVIGHRNDLGWLITDAGWMAMSRDRGTAQQPVDHGYGAVLDVAGCPIPELRMHDANQEHGIVSRRDGGPLDVGRYPIGSQLRILPNHACATAAQYDAYHVVDGTRDVIARWERFGGW